MKKQTLISSWLAPLVAMLLVLPLAAQRNTIDCGDVVNSALPQLPEIASSGGILSGTLYTISQQVRMPNQTTPVTCYPQWVRAYSATQPSNWNPSSSTITSPSPGPTLRARVGDIVNLTFVNVIDANKFPGVDDEKCDGTSKYPGQSGDSMPNCFHGSVYTNLHYHGTHVSPNTTADNVFLQILPSPRKTDGTNAPYITGDTMLSTFADFYKQCNAKLTGATGPVMWPQYWLIDPSAALKTALLDNVQKYAPQYVQTNQNLIDQGSWPQYFVGAYPYCFQLPQYTSASKTSTATPAVRTPHTHGAGSAEVREAAAPARPLIMGQSPGTHWYHAHKHGSTTINVQNGMTGVFIIEGPYDDALNGYYGAGFTKKLPVMVVQQLGTTPGLLVGGGGAPGGNFAVNGKINPTLQMAGGSVGLFRIANNAGRAGMYFDAPAGLQWKQLAQDGVQFNDANYNAAANLNRAFLLASGNRADLLVKIPKYNSAAGANNSYQILVYNTIDPSDRPPFKPAAAADTLLTVQVTPDGPAMDFMPNAPAFPPFLNDVTDAEIKGTKTLTFASTPLTPTGAANSQHTIDGKKFSGEVGASVMMNTAEEWKIVNQTYPPATLNQIAHPFHIHVNPFQVTELFDPNTVLSSKAGLGKVNITIDQATNVTTVTGSDGAKFTSEFQPGDWIWMNGSRANGGGPMAPGMVLSIKDDTTMTIDAVTAGPNLSGFPSPVSYVAAVPLYTAYKSPGRVGQCVLDPNDQTTWKPCNNPVPATNRIWWDVFSIPSGHNFVDATGKQVAQIPGYFKMRSRFVGYSGEFVMHCHILAHEDRGMMTNVVVTPLQSRYSHH